MVTFGMSDLAGILQIGLSMWHFPASQSSNFKESWQERGNRRNLQQMRRHVAGRRRRCLEMAVEVYHVEARQSVCAANPIACE